MEGLINLFNTLHDVEPIVTLLLGVVSFSIGFVGGMLKQKYTEGKIKGEIDTKFANAGKKIEAIDKYIDGKINPRLDALEDAINAYSQSLLACQSLQQERFNTRQAELISAVKTMIADAFRDLELRMDALRDRARKEKREELEELKTYVDDKFSGLGYEKANSL